MNRPRLRLLVPALLLLAAGCNDRDRMAPPPKAVPAAETQLPPPGPFVRVLPPQPDRTIPAPEPSPLDTCRIDAIHLEDVPLDTACQLLSRLLQANVVAAGAARQTRITLQLTEVSGRVAIEGLCRLHGLWYREDPGMVRILTAADYGSELVVRHEDETRLYHLRNASAIGIAEFLAALIPHRVVFNRPSEESSFGHVGTDGDDPMTGGTATGADTGTGGNGAAVRRASAGSTQVNVGTLAAPTAAPTAEQVAQAVQAAQRAGSHGGAVIGSRALADRATGAAVLSIFLRNNCIAVRAVDETLQREIGQLIAELDTPTRQVLLEVKVLRLKLGNGFASFFNLAYQDAGPPQVSASFLSGAQISNSTVSFSVLDSRISATMQLLQTDGRMHAIATPMLLAANNAPAEFFSGVQRMITVNYDFETRYAENGTATDIARPVVEEREIGTSVKIKPSVNDDGTVTLRFGLQLMSVNPGGASISQIQGDHLVQLPIDTVDNERVTSIVVANHGQTVVMGGLISESASFQRKRVPGLSEIPALGALFRQNDDQIERHETVVLITPHIMATPADGAAGSDGVLRRTSVHPWVRHGRSPVTVLDEADGKVKAIDFAPPRPAKTEPPAGGVQDPGSASHPAPAPAPGPTP